MFQSAGKDLMTAAGVVGFLILVYLLVVHGDATVGILKASGNFVTTETATLQGR